MDNIVRGKKKLKADTPVRMSSLRTLVSVEEKVTLTDRRVLMEGSCWDNIYEKFRAEYAYENDVEMFDVTDNPMEEMTDYSDTFTTNKIFDNRDELLKWKRETAITHGFVVVIVRSDAGGNGRKTTLVLGCERSGKYKPYKNKLIRKVLCQFHIDKNVKAKFRTYVSHTQEWQPIMDTWMSLMHSSTESDFEMQLTTFEQMCLPFGLFLNYVKNTWLIPHKEKFVDAWINKVMHLGTTTTNRVESAHSRLKNMLQDSRGDLCNCWDAMNNMITLQHTKIKASFQRSIMVLEHHFNNPLYNELRGLVSRNALALIDVEKQRINYVGIDISTCGCTLRNTHGLPCACQLARVHTHWMKLTFNDGGIDGPGCGLSVQPECDEVLRTFEKLDLSGKVVLNSKMREVAFPETTSMCPPPNKIKTKGGVKGKFKSKYSTKRDPSFFEHVDAMHSQHESCSTQPPGFQSQPRCKKQVTILDQLPSVLHLFIVRVDDVEADGNCGYRAIAASLGFGEDSWPVIRDELSRELVHFRAQYIQLFGGVDRFNQLRMSLFVDCGKTVSVDKWMTLPDMGYVIASRYNLVLVSLSKSGSMTFFPLRGHPKSSHQITCIGYVYGNHFVQVELKDGCPIPPTALQWRANRLPEAEAWEFPYCERMAAFLCLFSDNETQHVPTIIDLLETNIN
ncbi:Protein FAR1-RELATED SEQUENCE 6 [Sesbania bispinosa]|nr:Protein FAR1-RELATED SEQUENCE 6 [Sesbania bispinosa]